MRDLAGQHVLTILAGDDPTFFPSLLHTLRIPTRVQASPARFGGIDWRGYQDVYAFNMSDYLHTFADYQARFTQLLVQTNLVAYATVVLNYPRTYGSDTTYTIELPTHMFLADWDSWFGEQTLLITRDGALVLEAWDDHSFDIRTNFCIKGSKRFTGIL